MLSLGLEGSGEGSIQDHTGARGLLSAGFGVAGSSGHLLLVSLPTALQLAWRALFLLLLACVSLSSSTPSGPPILLSVHHTTILASCASRAKISLPLFFSLS